MGFLTILIAWRSFIFLTGRTAIGRFNGNYRASASISKVPR